MLPEPLASTLPTIIHRAAVRVVTCPPDPRLSPAHVWPVAERSHVVALAFQRSATDGLDVGCCRLRGVVT